MEDLSDPERYKQITPSTTKRITKFGNIVWESGGRRYGVAPVKSRPGEFWLRRDTDTNINKWKQPNVVGIIKADDIEQAYIIALEHLTR